MIYGTYRLTSTSSSNGCYITRTEVASTNAGNVSSSVTIHLRHPVKPVEDLELEQHLQEREFVRKVAGDRAAVVPRFRRFLLLRRPEFHARSHPIRERGRRPAVDKAARA